MLILNGCQRQHHLLSPKLLLMLVIYEKRVHIKNHHLRSGGSQCQPSNLCSYWAGYSYKSRMMHEELRHAKLTSKCTKRNLFGHCGNQHDDDGSVMHRLESSYGSITDSACTRNANVFRKSNKTSQQGYTSDSAGVLKFGVVHREAGLGQIPRHVDHPQSVC